jgi:thymidine kinase
MAELIYYCGTMDSGKSTLALQTAHNHDSRGRAGILFTNRDRAGSGKISSRLGLTSEALEVTEDMDLHKFVVDQLSTGKRIDYVICDEAQFGILTDFRTKLFPGSARLVELADRVHTLQVEALCWCGERATHNARTIGGAMVTEGEQVVVGDTNAANEVAYEVLCRRHHMRKVTARNSGAAHQSSDPLPFN